ncbi:hypothetical protein NQ315_002992 [Exocentrus adspersus]|uniref:Fanconi-associated nuclease n=1 Tax=Exocentrus adspersus TaxID=1586481 RepID=A0AAV8W3Z8_9CUCU|nr:hypothetical protein NQ315_002992 [Exocentrus adspersus]
MKQQYFNQQCPSFSPTNIGLDDETIPFGSLDLVNHARMDEMRLLNFIGAGLTQPSFDRISINERSLQNNNIEASNIKNTLQTNKSGDTIPISGSRNYLYGAKDAVSDLSNQTQGITFSSTVTSCNNSMPSTSVGNAANARKKRKYAYSKKQQAVSTSFSQPYTKRIIPRAYTVQERVLLKRKLEPKGVPKSKRCAKLKVKRISSKTENGNQLTPADKTSSQKLGVCFPDRKSVTLRDIGNTVKEPDRDMPSCSKKGLSRSKEVTYCDSPQLQGGSTCQTKSNNDGSNAQFSKRSEIGNVSAKKVAKKYKSSPKPKDSSGKGDKNRRNSSLGQVKVNKRGPNAAPYGSVKLERAKKVNDQLEKELTVLTELFATVLTSNLLGNQKELILIFNRMDRKYRYVCIKLFISERKWYNVFKFCKDFDIPLDKSEIPEMFAVFEKNNIVDTNYLEDDMQHLLECLDTSDLSGICDKFKLPKTAKKSTVTNPDSSDGRSNPDKSKLQTSKRLTIISNLLKCFSSSSSLSNTKNMLMDEIKYRMSKSMRISEAFYNAFFTTYVLATYTNPRLSNVQEYFTGMLKNNVVFPVYPIDNYTVFSTRNDFLEYIKARRYTRELELVSADHVQVLQISKTIFQELKSKESERIQEYLIEAPHLIQFTAKAVYINALSQCVDQLYTKFPNEVKEWLLYMIKEVNYKHRIGDWYCHLVWLFMRYIEPKNYDHAAELLIDVLQNNRQYLSEVQLYKLREKADQHLLTKQYKILQINHDRIVELLPKPIRVDNFPTTTLSEMEISSDISSNCRSNTKIPNMIKSAVAYYAKFFGYTGCWYRGGDLIKAIFTLFFYDIIYSERIIVSGAFISKNQCVPLDMGTKYFYLNRRQAIDNRIAEIEREWTDDMVIQFLEGQYDRHSHEFAVCEVGLVIQNKEFLKLIVQCTGRQVLAKICERLATDFSTYECGFPDLYLWNEKGECKFVTVKKKTDKLPVEQMLWIHYLNINQAQIEVCCIDSTDSKKKKGKNIINQPEPSTSYATPAT